MSRLDENQEVLKLIQESDAIADKSEMTISLLCDISRSLAIIADKDENNGNDKEVVKDDVLNRIRSEIEQRPYGIANDSVVQGMKYERADILEIIDKYILKGEDKK